MKTRFFFMIAAVMLLFGCKDAKNNIVKIGVIGPLTGTGATTSEYWVNGFNLAVEQLNANQTGVTYELIIEDCQSDPAQTVACYKRLEMQGVRYVVAVGGQFAMAVAPLTKDKDVLFFTTADYNEAILDQTNHGFRVFPSSAAFADSAVNYMSRTYGYTNFATFALNTAACLDATTSFAKGVERVGGKMVFQETYDIGAYEFKSVVSRVTDKKAQGIFMTGFGISPVAFVNQIATNKAFDNVALFGDLNIATRSFIENNKNTKATILYSDVRFPEEMENDYMERFNGHSNAIATSSYIIPFLIQDAQTNATEKTIDGMLKYLRGNTINTAIGAIKINDRGSCDIPLQVYHL